MNRPFIPILAYHKVQKKFDYSVTFVKPQIFERQIRFLHDRGFRTVSLTEYLTKKNLPPKSVIITFDDAYASVYENAYPILNRYKFTAVIFVITRFIGQLNLWDYPLQKFSHCGWEELKELSDAGWEIGSHSVNHFNLCSLSDSDLWYELRYSKDFLENHLGSRVDFISYPFGKFDDRVVQFVRRAGYRGACTLGQTPAPLPFSFTLFRRGVYCMEPFALFRAKLLNNRLSHLDDLKQRAISFCSQGTQFLRYLKAV